MTDRAPYGIFLRARYRVILGYTGLVCAIIGAIILAPALLVPFFPDQRALAGTFLFTGLTLLLLSAVTWRLCRPPAGTSLGFNEGAVVVVLSWLVAIGAGAIPFLASGLDVTRAVFESTSGWTTTGLSVIDVSSASALLLFFRSLMQLAGGAGLAILMLSALTGPPGVSLSSAEGHGTLLVPHVRRSARLVMTLYSSYVLFGIGALKGAGMDWFDAVNHAFCALSTGGFSTRAESIGAWNSAAVELVTMLLMGLGMTNFLVGYALWHGRWQALWRNAEIRLLLFVVPLFVLCLYGGVTRLLDGGSGPVRAAVFQTVTALSTTGYATVDLHQWHGLGWMLLILLMLIGGGVGSTAGGLKQYRIYALAQGVLWQIKGLFRAAGVVNQPVVWIGERRRFLSDRELRRIGTYLFFYLAVWLGGSTALTAFGHPPAASLFEFASTLGTVGLSVGVTSAAARDGQLWVQICGMILGRLEFFVVFAGLFKVIGDLPALLRRQHKNHDRR